MNKLQSSFKEFKRSRAKHELEISGILGITINGAKTVEVPNRDAFVYVKLRDNQSELIQAFNDKVSPVYGLPVKVKREGNRYIVVGRDTERYGDWQSYSAFLPRHGNTHSFNLESGGGGDIVWVYSRQFIPMLSFPSGSLGGPNVIIHPYTLKDLSGNWRYVGPTGTPNLTQYKPTGSDALMVLVYVDSTNGNPYIIVNSGTHFAASITGSAEILPYVPVIPSNNPNYLPDSFIRLVSGTSVISWDNIYDARQFIAVVPTGTTGGAGTPGGSNQQVQYNDNGVFGGDENFLWDETSNRLSISSSGRTGTFSRTGIDTSWDGSPRISFSNYYAALGMTSGPLIEFGDSSRPTGIYLRSIGVGSVAVLSTELLTSARHYSFPNKSGTFALLSDISSPDDTYLRLDASNDPVTGKLQITTDSPDIGASQFALDVFGRGVNESGVRFRSMDAIAIEGEAYNDPVSQFEQYPSGTIDVNVPVTYMYRSPNFGSPRFINPILYLYEDSGAGKLYGGLVWGIVDGTTRLVLNPTATGTVSPYRFDTAYGMPTGTRIVDVRHSGTTIFDIDKTGNTNIPSNSSYMVNGTPHTHDLTGRQWLPFSTYTHINPLSANPSYPFGVTIDRTMTLIKWAQMAYVATTNNASNHWRLTIIRQTDNAVIDEINTSAMSPDVSTLLTDTSFDISQVGAADTAIFIQCQKSGSPGNLYVQGPLVEVSVL